MRHHPPRPWTANPTVNLEPRILLEFRMAKQVVVYSQPG